LALWRLEKIIIGFYFAIVLHIQLDETLLSSKNKTCTLVYHSASVVGRRNTEYRHNAKPSNVVRHQKATSL